MEDSRAAAYSLDGTMTDEALQATIHEALARAKMTTSVPISQVADRTLLSEAQTEMGVKP
jgi:hypothetical protein